MLLLKYPFRVIPPIPPKAWFNGSETFVASRRRSLEEFIYLICNHPVLQGDQSVQEFLSSEDLSSLRTTLQSPWREEFASTSHKSPLATTVKEPSYLQFEDAKRWSSQVKGVLDDIRRTLLELAADQQKGGRQFTKLATHLSSLLENTQHSTTAAAALAQSFGKICDPYDRLCEIMTITSLKLEVFTKLISGCQVSL